MDNDSKFTWSKMSLCFPEAKEEMSKFNMSFNNCYPQSPYFSNDRVSFAYKKDYGIQMFINNPMVGWLKKESKEYKMVSRIHSDLSHKVYDEVIKELDASFEILEGWRHLISKYNGNEWKGNLQNSLYFENKGNQVNLGDYYKFYLNSDSKDNCPTSILHKIQKLPKNSLNEKWKTYYQLADNISKGEYKGESNLIIGKDLTECIKNADEIYKIADELKKLKF